MIHYDDTLMTPKNTPPSNKDPKDGFDLIEYPCDYLFKAMCRANADMQTKLTDCVLKYVTSDEILEVRSNQSRTAKFESISFTVRLHNRAELESIYQEIASCKNVLMTL